MKRCSRTLGSLLLVFLALMLLLVGCTPTRPQPSAGPQDQVIKIRLGHNQDTNSPQHHGAEAFKEKVAELSHGRLQVTIYPNMQLGQMREQAEQVQNGTLEMTEQPASVLSNFAPALEAYDLPFLFANTKALHSVVTGPVGQALLKKLEEKGLVGLGYETGGLKHITANFPVHTPADLKGKKMRVMPAPILIETYKALGANPTPVEYGELYNALQQGVVDGQENPLQTVVMLKLYEVQKNLTLTGNGPMLYLTVANKKWFDALPADLQQNIRDAMAYADGIVWDEIIQGEKAYLKEIQAHGMQVYVPSAGDLAAFRAATQPVVAFVAKRVGQDIVTELQQAAAQANSRETK
ncbi:MAG TPA: TRAP transporter substrate-binding protein [Firmicutes bacterium]|nr:TRAP transporter substrate-binding protein [Bacillota bacterium]